MEEDEPQRLECDPESRFQSPRRTSLSESDCYLFSIFQGFVFEEESGSLFPQQLKAMGGQAHRLWGLWQLGFWAVKYIECGLFLIEKLTRFDSDWNYTSTNMDLVWIFLPLKKASLLLDSKQPMIYISSMEQIFQAPYLALGHLCLLLLGFCFGSDV